MNTCHISPKESAATGGYGVKAPRLERKSTWTIETTGVKYSTSFLVSCSRALIHLVWMLNEALSTEPWAWRIGDRVCSNDSVLPAISRARFISFTFAVLSID